MAEQLISRNSIDKYTYFFEIRKVVNPISNFTKQEISMYQFENPISAARGIAYIKNTETVLVYQLSDVVYQRGTYTHPTIRNQNNELATYKYSDIKITYINVAQSRNIN